MTGRFTQVAIGWDVRGWCSRGQAVAVLALEVPDNPPAWLGVSAPFQLPTGEPLGLAALLAPAVDAQQQADIRQADSIVIGIDAPLAFPRKLVELLATDNMTTCNPPAREITNPLAYRDCERWIHRHFHKKPLSAAFDRIGNNATLAICMARALQAEGFALVPHQVADAAHAVIEVYPGIVKRGQKKTDPAIPPLQQLVPGSLVPGTDPYDAAICALLAASFAGLGAQLGLPAPTGPAPGYDPAEGWIYALPADFVQAHSTR